MKKQAVITLLSLLLVAFPASAQDGAAASGGKAPQAQGPKGVRKYVVPLILAASDAAGNRQFTFDTTIFITYTPGLAGLGAGPGASVDLFLFDDTAGDPLRSPSGQAVCNPCTFQVGTAARTQSVRIDDLITGAVASDAGVGLGFAVIVVGGADPDGVNIRGRVVGSHAGGANLSVFGFEPQPLAAVAQ